MIHNCPDCRCAAAPPLRPRPIVPVVSDDFETWHRLDVSPVKVRCDARLKMAIVQIGNGVVNCPDCTREAP